MILRNSPQEIVSLSFLGLKFAARQAFRESGVGSATRDSAPEATISREFKELP
jgi:hypothetical protein